MTTINVFSKPGCVQCTATERALDRRDITYRTIDISKDATAMAAVKKLGYQQVPVVLIQHTDGSKEHWSGFKPDKIAALSRSGTGTPPQPRGSIAGSTPTHGPSTRDPAPALP